jgi:O-antigen/teichoic acid export membrane protein
MNECAAPQRTAPAGASPRRAAWLSAAGWGGKSLASIADQGAAAAITFVSAIFVGQMLGAAALGLLAVTNIAVLALRQLQAGAVLEPLIVYGARHDPADRDRYTGFLWLLHGSWTGGLVALGLAVTLLAARAGLIDRTTALALAAALLFATLITTQYLLRRWFYADERPQAALAQSLAFLVLVLAGLAALAASGQASVAGLYLLLAAASALVCLIQVRRLHRPVQWPRRRHRRQFLAEHLAYGRWALLATPIQLAAYQGYFVLTSLRLSAEETGHLKAADALVAVFAQVTIGLALLLVPVVARRWSTVTAAQRRRWRQRLTLASLGLGILFAGAMLLLGPAVITLAFGPELAPARAIVPIMALVPVCLALAMPAQVMLAAQARSKPVFLAQLAGAAVTAVAGLPLLAIAGLSGAAAGMVLAQAVIAGCLWLQLLRLDRRAGAAPAAG